MTPPTVGWLKQQSPDVSPERFEALHISNELPYMESDTLSLKELQVCVSDGSDVEASFFFGDGQHVVRVDGLAREPAC